MKLTLFVYLFVHSEPSEPSSKEAPDQEPAFDGKMQSIPMNIDDPNL